MSTKFRPKVIREATTSSDIITVSTLFREYAASLGHDLEFQHFSRELETLPGEYAGPAGCLLLAWEGDEALGCVAIRPLEFPEIGELKRLFVRPGYRGRELGRTLCTEAIARARGMGYRRLRLDTMPSMHEARRLYTNLGFREISAYRFNPISGAIFMELSI
jgi:ribosomal protein S18 acetylase RimI-like enzyme